MHISWGFLFILTTVVWFVVLSWFCITTLKTQGSYNALIRPSTNSQKIMSVQAAYTVKTWRLCYICFHCQTLNPWWRKTACRPLALETQWLTVLCVHLADLDLGGFRYSLHKVAKSTREAAVSACRTTWPTMMHSRCGTDCILWQITILKSTRVLCWKHGPRCCS